MDSKAHGRHDISDKLWRKMEWLLSGGTGKVGRHGRDNCQFINAVFWIMRTGAPWKDLPPDFGDWKNTHRRFSRWRDCGVWESLVDKLCGEPDMQWEMVDSTHVKVHQHGTGASGGRPGNGSHKRGLNTKLHVAVDKAGHPNRNFQHCCDKSIYKKTMSSKILFSERRSGAPFPLDIFRCLFQRLTLDSGLKNSNKRGNNRECKWQRRRCVRSSHSG
jgi:transposase